jgi:hypothetical protein
MRHFALTMARVTFLVGLPGSGKTTFVQEFAKRGGTCFDDYKSRANHNSSRFDDSRYFAELVTSLAASRDCVISDIDFCRAEARNEAVTLLHRHVPGVEVEWRCYENAPDQCRLNVLQRSRNSLQSDLQAIEKYAKVYAYPNGCTPIPVSHTSCA